MYKSGKKLLTSLFVSGMFILGSLSPAQSHTDKQQHKPEFSMDRKKLEYSLKLPSQNLEYKISVLPERYVKKIRVTSIQDYHRGILSKFNKIETFYVSEPKYEKGFKITDFDQNADGIIEKRVTEGYFSGAKQIKTDNNNDGKFDHIKTESTNWDGARVIEIYANGDYEMEIQKKIDGFDILEKYKRQDGELKLDYRKVKKLEIKDDGTNVNTTTIDHNGDYEIDYKIVEIIDSNAKTTKLDSDGDGKFNQIMIEKTVNGAKVVEIDRLADGTIDFRQTETKVKGKKITEVDEYADGDIEKRTIEETTANGRITKIDWNADGIIDYKQIDEDDGKTKTTKIYEDRDSKPDYIYTETRDGNLKTIEVDMNGDGSPESKKLERVIEMDIS